MKTTFTIELEVTHNNLFVPNELADMLELILQDKNPSPVATPDDFGATKYIVKSIMVGPTEEN